MSDTRDPEDISYLSTRVFTKAVDPTSDLTAAPGQYSKVQFSRKSRTVETAALERFSVDARYALSDFHRQIVIVSAIAMNPAAYPQEPVHVRYPRRLVGMEFWLWIQKELKYRNVSLKLADLKRLVEECDRIVAARLRAGLDT